MISALESRFGQSSDPTPTPTSSHPNVDTSQNIVPSQAAPTVSSPESNGPVQQRLFSWYRLPAALSTEPTAVMPLIEGSSLEGSSLPGGKYAVFDQDDSAPQPEGDVYAIEATSSPRQSSNEREADQPGLHDGDSSQNDQSTKDLEATDSLPQQYVKAKLADDANLDLVVDTEAHIIDKKAAAARTNGPTSLTVGYEIPMSHSEYAEVPAASTVVGTDDISKASSALACSGVLPLLSAMMATTFLLLS
jgi:hypothetical protein